VSSYGPRSSAKKFFTSTATCALRPDRPHRLSSPFRAQAPHEHRPPCLQLDHPGRLRLRPPTHSPRSPGPGSTASTSQRSAGGGAIVSSSLSPSSSRTARICTRGCFVACRAGFRHSCGRSPTPSLRIDEGAERVAERRSADVYVGEPCAAQRDVLEDGALQVPVAAPSRCSRRCAAIEESTATSRCLGRPPPHLTAMDAR
jgi:hypothetical protein